MSTSDFFARLREALEVAGVPYMLTGSFASSIHGVPRATQDVDIVIAPTRAQLILLLAQFPESQYYVSAEAALAAFVRHGQFNVIDTATGWKVDFILRKPRHFSREEFERRRPAEVSGVLLEVTSPEDILVAKLEWSKLGRSGRQLEDVAGIIQLQGEKLDREYVERWVRALGLEAEWESAQGLV